MEDGKREGECSVTCLENGIRMLRASYYNDRPEGFVTLEREDGGWREGFCLDGRWDGLVREFDEDRRIRFIGKYEAGLPVGKCWIRMTGGGYLHGEVDADWRLTSENGFYIYPDMEVAYNGVFSNSVMVKGRAALIEPSEVVNNVMTVKVTKLWGPEREYREATEDCLSTFPLLRDPYEERLTEIGTSGIPGGGDGLFAKVDIPPGTLIAIYNGVKRGPYANVSTPDDWDKCGYSIGYYESTTSDKGWGDMDIPVKFQTSDTYVATVAHKMNHSFNYNCEFSDLTHPIYGYIPCTITTKHIPAGEELFVHYHYVLNDCPQWYEDLYNQL